MFVEGGCGSVVDSDDGSVLAANFLMLVNC